MPDEKIQVLDKGYVRLVDHMGSDISVVNAARVSYDKEVAEMSERDQRLLTYLTTHNHESPFRHAAVTLEAYAPLMVARQWWKYAVASTHVDDQNGWNESSRRYITENEEFHIPDVWRLAPENSKQGSGSDASHDISVKHSHWLRKHIAESERLYREALDDGLAPEQARLFLPAYGMYVRWRWTVSLTGLIHFLSQRIADDAQVEIRQYALAVRELTSPLFPLAFESYGIS